MSNGNPNPRLVAEFLAGLRHRHPEALALESSIRPSLAEDAESAGASQHETNLIASADARLRRGEELEIAESMALESIILPYERPVLNVVNDRFSAPSQRLWRYLADDGPRARIERACLAIGRVELVGDTIKPYLGTGFMVGDGLLITNRHVADDFVAGVGTTLRFICGLGGRVDLERWNQPSDGLILRVEAAEMVHPWWDAAILRVSGFPAGRKALRLLAEPPNPLEGRAVAAIGYPAFDSRCPTDIQNRVFGGVYGVKRLQPGLISAATSQVQSFGKLVEALGHDCSTLGGNSGSALVDIETGYIVGLHFGGSYLVSNYAVPAWELCADERVRKVGILFEGSPGTAGEWVSAWQTLTSPAAEAPAFAGGVQPAGSPGQESALDWYENSTDAEIARAYREQPEFVRSRLESILDSDEVGDLLGDINEELEAAEAVEESWLSREPDPNLPEIVFLHGIMGGHLAHRGFFRDRLWLDLKELVRGNLAERMTLGPDGTSDHGKLRIEPDGHIQLKYRKAARKWRRDRFVVHQFSYDWRKGVRDAAHQLNLFLEQRAAQTHGKPVVLVAHSMGGLVCSLYSDRYPSWADRVLEAVLIGSPLGGSYSVPMAVTGYHGLLTKLAWLARADNLVEFRRMAASLPGLLDMLPHPNLFTDAGEFFTQSGWPEPVVPAQRWLRQSLNLKSVLRSSPLLERTALLVNLTHGTITSMPFENGKRVPGPRTGVGDGTVPGASALIDGVPAYEVDYEHSDLAKDPKVIRAVVDLVTTGKVQLPLVDEACLDAALSATLEEETFDEAEWTDRRNRFDVGAATEDDLTWLGSL